MIGPPQNHLPDRTASTPASRRACSSSPRPLPAAAAPTGLVGYIARRGHCIHKLKAKDTTGRWAYYFVLVEPDLEVAFLDAIEGEGTIDLEHYGRVIASCYGETPSQEVRDLLKNTYDFDV
jgi:hypothetical protein